MPPRSSRRRLTPASDRVSRDRGTGRSLTPHPDREDPAVLDQVLVLGPAPADLVLVVRGLVDLGRAGLVVTGRAGLVILVPPRRAGPVELVLVGQGDRVELMGRVALVVPVPPRLVGRAVPVELDLARLVAPAVLVPPVAMALVDRADLARRAAPVDRVGLMSLVDRAGLADRVELMSRADRAAPLVPDLMGRVDLAGQAAPVDRHRRRTSNTVSTTGVAPRWAAPGTCRTGSARRITGRRLRPGSTDSAGTVGLPPVLRRLSGTDHHLQVAGAGLRLPVVGTAHGTGRRAMSQSRSVISGRLVTTGTTQSRCSTRYSVDGASGSSVSGSRCTDLTASTPD
jgi:hypothetical protein